MENLLEVGRLKGIPEEEIKKRASDLLADYDRIFSQSMPANAGEYVLPGVRALGQAGWYR